jgi:hypothetical protein
MADQITKIIIRQGTKSEKNSITLSSGEFGYTTDQKRVFIGDGSTTGGITVGNKFIGYYNLNTSIADVEQIIEYGDLVFDTSDSTLVALTGADAGAKNNYIRLSNKNSGTVTEITSGDGLIFNTSDTSITTTGTINLKIDTTKRNPLTVSSNGTLINYDNIYPVNSVIYTADNVNPTASGGRLEGSGQTWEAAGYVTTVGTGSTNVYAWKRTG